MPIGTHITFIQSVPTAMRPNLAEAKGFVGYATNVRPLSALKAASPVMFHCHPPQTAKWSGSFGFWSMSNISGKFPLLPSRFFRVSRLVGIESRCS